MLDNYYEVLEKTITMQDSIIIQLQNEILNLKRDMRRFILFNCSSKSVSLEVSRKQIYPRELRPFMESEE